MSEVRMVPRLLALLVSTLLIAACAAATYRTDPEQSPCAPIRARRARRR